MMTHSLVLPRLPEVVAASNLAGTFILWWIAQIVAVAILVILFLRWRPGFLRKRTIGEMLGQSLDAREARIQEQLDAAQRSRDEAERIHQESQRSIEQARQEAQNIVARAAQTSQAIQEDISARAREEYDRIVGQARSQIDYEREQAEMKLRRQAADIVIDAAQQIVQRHLQPKTDERLIDESLADMRRAP